MTEGTGHRREDEIDLERTDQTRTTYTDQEGTDQVGTPGHDDRSVVIHEERAELGTELHESGRVKVRKHVETYPVEEVVPRSIEHADTSERVAATEGDSGEVETLEDGSVSIPIFEEVLVVTKRLVVRERVIVRKRTVVDEYRLQTDLRREHATVETDGDVEVAGAEGLTGTGTSAGTGTAGTTGTTAPVGEPGVPSTDTVAVDTTDPAYHERGDDAGAYGQRYDDRPPGSV